MINNIFFKELLLLLSKMSLETKTLSLLNVIYPDYKYWHETIQKIITKQVLNTIFKNVRPIESKTLEIIENINGLVTFELILQVRL